MLNFIGKNKNLIWLMVLSACGGTASVNQGIHCPPGVALHGNNKSKTFSLTKLSPPTHNNPKLTISGNKMPSSKILNGGLLNGGYIDVISLHHKSGENAETYPEFRESYYKYSQSTSQASRQGEEPRYIFSESAPNELRQNYTLEVKRCNFFIDFASEDNDKPFYLWTANHCAGTPHTVDIRVRLAIAANSKINTEGSSFEPPKYSQRVKMIFPELDGHRKARNLSMARIDNNNNAGDLLSRNSVLSKFKFGAINKSAVVSADQKSESLAFGSPLCATNSKQMPPFSYSKKIQKVCALLDDHSIIKAVLDPESITTEVKTAFAKMRKTQKEKRVGIIKELHSVDKVDIQNCDKNPIPDTHKEFCALSFWSATLHRIQRMDRLYSLSDVLDQIADSCVNNGTEAAKSSKACTWEEILNQTVTVSTPKGEEGAMEFARSQKHKEGTAEAMLREELNHLKEAYTQNWKVIRKLLPELQKKGIDLSLHNNYKLSEKPIVHNNVKYDAVTYGEIPFKQFVSKKALFGLKDYGMVIFLHANDIKFIHQDSGSVISVGGAFPILPISTLNNEEISGGVAIEPPPEGFDYDEDEQPEGLREDIEAFETNLEKEDDVRPVDTRNPGDCQVG